MGAGGRLTTLIIVTFDKSRRLPTQVGPQAHKVNICANIRQLFCGLVFHVHSISKNICAFKNAKILGRNKIVDYMSVTQW